MTLSIIVHHGHHGIAGAFAKGACRIIKLPTYRVSLTKAMTCRLFPKLKLTRVSSLSQVQAAISYRPNKPYDPGKLNKLILKGKV